MHMCTFFSVIIPLYNKEAYIGDTLKSVLNQTFQSFEIIIVNDGSTDNSLKITKKFNDKRLRIYTQKNQGVSFARNYGIEKAKSEYIALIDADDLWCNNHLMELKKSIEKFAEAGLYCNNYEINYNGKFVKPARINLEYENTPVIAKDFFKASITNSLAWTSSVGFSKKTFDTLGGFDPNLETAQDLDLWIRMALNYNVVFNPVVTMRYNLHIDNSLSKSKLNTIRYDFINKYAKQEKQNASLKTYLDVNRYALALRCKLNNEKELYNKLKEDIDYTNLNWKQQLLIRASKKTLIRLKSLQNRLIKNSIYLTAFK